jgi:murein DD-endopeptidase MepM/ murein hydrolase activator NlpD
MPLREAPFMQRRHAPLVIAATLLALMLSTLITPVSALAVSPGSGAWYWPTGTEDFGGHSGWWDYRPWNHSWHMAQDMPAAVGARCYAIGDGTVLESGDGHGYGGVIVVLHRTAEGKLFKAVYGHIRRGAFPKGAKVRAGQVIGWVNSAHHVHFGIHPGRAYPSDNNPYRGHTYVRAVTYGWVDPIAFLKANPRILKYRAPALPVVATVSTELTPTVLGSSDGRVFWIVEPSGSVFSSPISGDGTPTVASPTDLPVLDTARYLPSLLATSFTLRDRMPALTVAYSGLTPAWGRSIAVSGTLRNAVGAPFVGATVVLERSLDATSWTRVGSALTGLKGTWALSYRPTRAYRLRARFSPGATFITTTGREATVAPHAGLSAPDECASARAGRTFEVEGSLTPRHAAGSRTVTLRFQRYTGGRWVEASTHLTTNRDSGPATRYHHRVALSTGRWRVRAETPADSLHAATVSGWFAIAVR